MRNDSSSEFVSPIRYTIFLRIPLLSFLYKFPILSERFNAGFKIESKYETGWGIYRRNKRVVVYEGVIGVRGYRVRARERLVRNICTAS